VDHSFGKKPPSPEDLDDLKKLQRDSTRVVAFAAIALAGLVLVVLIVGGSLAYTANLRLNKENSNLATTNAKLLKQEDVLTTAVTNTCSFFRDVATLPLETSGPNKAGKVSIRLIVDARNSYSLKLCVAPLPAIPEGVKKLAQQYGIALSDNHSITRSEIIEAVTDSTR